MNLKKMKLQTEMSSTNVMGMVERVMPLTQKREWVAVMDDSGSGLDFEKLLEYLLTQKRRIEYMGSAVRTIGSQKSSMSNVVSTETQNNDLCTLVKDLHENQASMERSSITAIECDEGT